MIITKARLERDIKFLGKDCKLNQASYYNTVYSKSAEIPAPLLKKYYKDNFHEDPRSIKEQLINWTQIWQTSQDFYVLSLACMFLEKHKYELEAKHWPILKKWSAKVENWVHSDVLSGVYAVMHERYPQSIYPTLQAWNKSKEPWLKRLSIVSLFYYSALRDRQPSFTKVTQLLLPLIEVEHYYVQKGVGWTFRELYNVYPEKTFSLLKKHIKVLSSAAWQAATEKLSKSQKLELKKIRK